MDVPFAKLVFRLGNPPISKKTTKPIQPSKIFASWLNHLPNPLPPHTVKQIFRLLFPHEGSRRRYGLKETKLAQELERLLGLKGLTRWDSVSWDRGGEAGTGCLGREVEIAMKDRVAWSSTSSTGDKSLLSIRELDLLLDELAASSPFSQLSQNPGPTRSVPVLLSIIYRDSNLSPYALSVVTQIILRDLRPLLSPLPRLRIRNPTAMLRLKSTAGPEQLTLRDAMMGCDKKMWDLYVGGRGDLDTCADLVEELDRGGSGLISCEPVIGVNVKIPKCRKGRPVEDALKEFTGTAYALPSEVVWAETKYDGYRLQIHVEVLKGRSPKITIFSKSTRNSTQDRLNAHAIVLATLGLPIDPALPAHPTLSQRLSAIPLRDHIVKKSVILEAEVVPYNETSREGGRGPGIEEFWWLGQAGVTIDAMNWAFSTTGFPRAPSRHLCLVFFDVLHLNGRSLLHQRYDDRRRTLESLVTSIPGFAQLAERTKIPLGVDRHSALEALQDAFKRSSERREEGLVLKAAESTYTNMRWQWVKLKKDYIPNLGDCIDLVLLGAGWDIDRARELRVDTSVFTTFYIGVLTNSERVKNRREMPHFEILFRSSYGLDRSQLEVYNEYIRHGRWASKPFDKDDPFKRRLLGLSWTYTLQRGMTPPSVMLVQPICAEVMGAGFQRLPGSELYELRWPRLQKVHAPSDRSWTEALTAQALISTAHQSLGYNITGLTSPRSPDDSIRAAWRSSTSIALIDVPELVSPPSPTRRTRSAPDLGEIWKTSPDTPERSSPQRLQSRGVESGRLLRDVTSDKGDVVTVVSGGEEDKENEEEGVMWLKSPIRRLGNGESPSKRRKPDDGPSNCPVTSPSRQPSSTSEEDRAVSLQTLRSPPLFSSLPPQSSMAITQLRPAKRLLTPIDWSCFTIPLTNPVMSAVVSHKKLGQGGNIVQGRGRGPGKGKVKGKKALSLRSRIKLVTKGIRARS
ncbi:hypothetical protein CI109_104670 [Kwoniella shandongensis]|uniref:ATP-dependent DNA ligase family profile domain-containing protein n=1 Tax=Kwoniella shandongensis TaxID=1734106 RepID=A0AAJ8LLT5_9TREE